MFEVFLEGGGVIENMANDHPDKEKTGQGVQPDGRNGEGLNEGEDSGNRHH